MRASTLFGGGVSFPPAQFFSISTTYTIPESGKYLISALGGGGSGAAIFSTSVGGAAAGGGGGGFAESAVTFAAGAVLTISVGAGGAQRLSSVSGTGVSGAVGGNTTVTGTGLSLAANGGTGGAFATTLSVTAAAGTGGSATGGTTNAAGG
jgi:hypothetical protein